MQHISRNGNRIAAAACISILLLSGLCILADSVSADEGTFFYEGVEYRIIDDESVAVHSIDPDAVGNALKIKCFVPEPKDYKEYVVRAIDADAFDKSETILTLFLPTTLTSIGKNAFKGLFDQQGEKIATVTLPGIVYGNMVHVPGLYDGGTEPAFVPLDEYISDIDSYDGRVRFLEATRDGVPVTLYIGIDDPAELKATNIDDFERGYYKDTFYRGCVNCFKECLYTRDYFECIGWSLEPGASEPEYGPMDNIAVDETFQPTDYYAIWEETGYDYPVWMFKATTAIILLLAVIGIAVVTAKYIRARRA